MKSVSTRLFLLLALVIASSGCGVSFEASPTRPMFPAIDAIGILATFEDYGDKTIYVLANGQRIERARDQSRVAYDLSGGSILFVAGTDAQGQFVALIGAPEDAPVGCGHMVRYGGRDWGDAIESQGLMWPKASGFESAVPTPVVGLSYSSNTLLCLDDKARVAAVKILVAPASSGPVGSAKAP